MANYLEREAKAKKDARRAKMGKRITSIEKMDATLEEIMKEPNLEGKIKQLEAELKEAQEMATEARGKADTIGEDKRQRDENGTAKFEEYKKEIEGKAQEAESKSKAIAKKLQFYKAFKENGKQILNIRTYQIELQKRLESLEEQKKLATQGQKDVEKVDTVLKKLEEDLGKLMTKRQEVEGKLRDSRTSDDERKKLETEKAKLEAQISDNNKKYTEVSIKKSEMKEPDTKKMDKLSADIASTQIKISKCNMIWTSLLKGKNWDEIQVILQTGDFTAKKGTLSKIRDLAKSQQEVDLEKVQAQTGRNVSQILDERDGKVGGSTEHGQGENEEQENAEEEREGLPAEVKSFAEEHPRLAKIPFLAKFMDRRAEKKRAKEEEIARNEEETEKEDTPREGAKDKDLAYIDRQMGKGRDAEMFRSIADKGIRETVKVDSETQYRLMRVTAARNQAKDFAQHDKSGRYQEQLKAEEARAKEAEEGREPGDD